MSDILRVGVIGGGNISRRLHLPVWMERDDVEVVAAADPSQAARDTIRELTRLGVENIYSDPKDLIARDDVDIVDVCTPPKYRCSLIVEAAERGKHIFAEKPLATTPADATRAVEATARNNVIFGVNHNYLVLDEIRAVLDVIHSGEIGVVRTANVNYLGVVDVPGATGDWRHDPARSGGGVLMDIVHAVYVLEAFLQEPIERVSAHIEPKGRNGHVEDLALCRFETKSRAGMVNIGWGFGDGHIDVTGTLGRVSIRYRDGGTAPWAPVEAVTVTTKSGTRTVLGPEDPRPETYDEFPPIAKTYPILLDRYVAAVRGEGSPVATGADALRALEGTIGAYASGATGQLVSLPLDRESPIFVKGTIGVRDLSLPEWSPVRGSNLFAAMP